MKIIIIGAGLSGLSTAIALRRYIKPDDNNPLTIKIYEKETQRDDPSEDRTKQRLRKLGAGLGLQSNGLQVLEDLDPKLKERVYASGFPCDHFKWKTAGNVLLSREYVNVLSISRPVIIDCLAESLAEEDSIEYRTVSEVVAREGEKPRVRFQDGPPEEIADLVIGADGVGSIVRKGLFNGKGEQEKYRPQYLGLCGVGGILEIPLPQHLTDEPSFQFFMGSTGHFGYTGLSQSDKNKLLYWSIWHTDLPEHGKKPDIDALQKNLYDRHHDWTDPMIKKCLENSKPDNIYPIFVMPELPHWGRDGCVLVGDAAHALPPNTGQGSSQAFTDAQTLSLLLAGHLERRPQDLDEVIARSIAGLYEVRSRRVYYMRAKAMRWKDPEPMMPWWKTMLLYAFLVVYVRATYLMSFFDGGRTGWDVKSHVKEYFEAEDGMRQSKK